MTIAGDDIVRDPQVTTNHAITIDAAPCDVWPWLVQMGWHRGGWYTARWVDRLLFPANWPSAEVIRPEFQERKVGDFIPDGAPETECGFVVVRIERGRHLVLHSNTHLPRSWREVGRASIDWSWAFCLTPLDDGQRTRFLFRSRWHLSPAWLAVTAWALLVPADFVMARDMLHGVARRAERR